MAEQDKQDKEEKRERFGRYLILDHLVDGGMAKICRARYLGQEADKVVAIKMVQPQFSQDDAFKRMFMDEIKVVFGLLHPNIIQTYDYGFHKGQLFVAMEYCDGRNLKEYLNRLKKKKFVFPVEVSVYIISQACQGLHYSHTYTDKLSGKPANIIHRDISPHNIMLTYDGAVKVIDFGIAKSDKSEDKTQAGTIKGKIGYLAPEYIEGLELDHRYDQFALGITLWEMLCARGLFKGPSDFAILKKIQDCQIPPPSTINPKVPKELDEIVLTALNPDRNKRHKNLDQLNRLLIKFLYANYPDFNSSDLAYFAKGLFKEEIKRDREKLFEYGKIDISPYLKDLKREQEGIIENEATRTRKKEQVIDFGLEESDANEPKIQIDRTSVSRKRGQGNSSPSNSNNVTQAVKKAISREQQQQMSMISAMKAEIEVSPVSMQADRKRLGQIAPPPLPRKPPPHQRDDDDDGQANSRREWVFLAAACIGVVAFFNQSALRRGLCMLGGAQVGLQSCAPKKAISKSGDSQDSIEEEIQRENLALNGRGEENVYLILRNFDKRTMKVYLDGIHQSTDILSRVSIPAGRVQTLRIESPGQKHFIQTIDSNGGENIEVTIPKREREFFGHLYSSADCRLSGTLSFEIYGEKRTAEVPIRSKLGIAFPVRTRGPANQAQRAQYTLFFRPSNKNFQKKLNLQFERVGQYIDICTLDTRSNFDPDLEDN